MKTSTLKTNGSTDTKIPWNDWLINCIPELIKNGGWH